LFKDVPFRPLISEEASEEFMINEVINWPFTIIFFVALLGLLVSVMLVTVNQTDIFPNRLLAAYLGCFSMFALNYSLMTTSFFLQFPHAWKILAWASFCFAPFGYLYVRSVLEQNFWFRRKDLWWFVPGFMHSLCLVPFFVLSSAKKQVILENIFANRKLIIIEPESILYDGVGVWMRVGVIAASAFAQMRILYKWKPNIFQNEGNHQNISNYKWLVLFSLTMLVFSILIIFQVFFHMVMPADLNLLVLFTIAFTILFVCFYLLYRPSILYGMRGWLQQTEVTASDAPIPEQTEPATESADPSIVSVDKKKIYLSADQGNTIRQVLENHLAVNSPFRKTGYTISDLSNEVNIPSYLLSAFINQEYGKNFNELINEYRVDFFLDLVKQPDANSQYKLEALGKEAGFNTRASFIRAVKKKTGHTPSDFVTKKHN
jgi:AraC-like DNA-binding protein